MMTSIKCICNKDKILVTIVLLTKNAKIGTSYL